MHRVTSSRVLLASIFHQPYEHQRGWEALERSTQGSSLECDSLWPLWLDFTPRLRTLGRTTPVGSRRAGVPGSEAPTEGVSNR